MLFTFCWKESSVLVRNVSFIAQFSVQRLTYSCIGTGDAFCLLFCDLESKKTFKQSKAPSSYLMESFRTIKCSIRKVF